MKSTAWMYPIITLAALAAARGTALATHPPAGGGPGAPIITVWRDPVADFVPDGKRVPGPEYAEALDLSGPALEGKVYLKRHRDPQFEELRIYFSINDNDAHPLDRIDFFFDGLHNHDGAGTVEDDVMLRIVRANCGGPQPECTARLIPRDPVTKLFDESPAASTVQLGSAVMLASTNQQSEFPGVFAWTGELKLRPQDLGWDYFPASVGAMVLARSANPNPPSMLASPRAFFPQGSNGDELAPLAWADLRLRYPIDYALSLDYSGSMLATDGLTQNRWARAKRAADLLVATLGILKNDLFDDRVGVSQYSWTCGTANNLTGQLPGFLTDQLQIIPQPPSGSSSFTSNNVIDPAANNCTPIRQGLTFALAQLEFAAPAERRDRVLVLLSDGFHNIPSPFDPTTDVPAAENSFVDAVTVAFGPDGAANTQLLSGIATAYSPTGSQEPGYIQASSLKELMTAYLDVLQHSTSPVTVNVVADGAEGTLTGSYSLAQPQRAVFIGVWNNPTQAVPLTVKRVGGDPVTGTLANTGIGFSAVTVPNATSGEWQFVSQPDHRFVIENLRVLARYRVEQRDYTTGEPMLLRVSLHDGGAPLTGAQAAVEVARPGEALGNYLSTVQQNCQPGVPQIPPGGPPGTTRPPTTVTPGDPPPGRYALAAAHFDRCGKDGLDRDSLPGLPLFDDGTHGDEAAGDGVYTRAYTDTDLEGSYNFRVNVRGTTTDGVEFARTRRFSQYVRVKPAPAATEHRVEPVDDANNLGAPMMGGAQAAVYWFLPRDTFGNYLGPGFADALRVTVPSGSLGGPLYDAGNGWYGQVVRWPTGSPAPPVRVEMPSTGFVTTLGPAGTATGRSEWEIFGSWTMLDDTLDVDDALGLGIRFAAPLGGPLRFELEGATTFPELGDDSVRVSQLFAGLRGEVALAPAVLASLSAGGGVMHFSGGGASETTGAGHASGALTLLLSPHFGIRGTGRLLYVDDVRGAGEATTGTQLTVGVVFRP